jgi:hypothetical protein
MTENRAFVLILVGMAVFAIAAFFGLVALGVRGIGLSFAFLIPLAIAADLNARVVMHYGAERRRRKR